MYLYSLIQYMADSVARDKKNWAVKRDESLVKIMRSCIKNHHLGLETWKNGTKQFMATALTNNLDSRLRLKHLRSQLKMHIFVSFSCVWPPMVNTQLLSHSAWSSRQLVWYALWKSQEPKELFLMN